MEIIISGRHFEVDNDLKGYVEGKIQKLADEYPKLTSARVVMSLERNWQIVDGHVNGKHLVLNASARTPDMVVSIDTMADKLQRQLRKYLERVQEHRAGARPSRFPVDASEEELEEELGSGLEEADELDEDWIEEEVESRS